MPMPKSKKVVRKQGENGTITKINLPKSGKRTVYSTPSRTSVTQTKGRRTTTTVTNKRSGNISKDSTIKLPKRGVVRLSSTMGLRTAKKK